MTVARRHWALALAGALLVHGGIAAAILWQPSETGAVGAGMGGIEVSLGPAGGAPGGEARPVADVAEVEAVEPVDFTNAEVPPEPVEVEQAQDLAPQQPAPELTEPLEPGAAPAETVAPEATTAAVEAASTTELAAATDAVPAMSVPEAVEAVAVEAPVPDAPPVEAVPAEADLAAAVAPEEAMVAAAAPSPSTPQRAEAVDLLPETVVAPPPPKPRPRRPGRPEEMAAVEPPPPAVENASPATEQPTEAAPPTVEKAAPATEQPSEAAPSTPGAGGRAGTQASSEAGSADASRGGGLPGATADYMALLQAWLERHKEYPRRAQLRRQEGTALLYFAMDREGRVLDHRLERSSGHDLLDEEVRAMIERAQPLPTIPDEVGQDRLEVVVPVQFLMR